MMTATEVIDLLTLIATYDQRTVGEADVHAWHIIATEERWTLATARRAVIEHHRRDADRGRIRPAHITDTIRAAEEIIRRTVLRTDLTPPRELADDPRAENTWRREVIAEAKRRALDAWAKGEPMPALEAALEPPPAVRQLVDAKLDPVPALEAMADARRVPASARREPADADQRAEHRDAARRELDTIRGRVSA